MINVRTEVKNVTNAKAKYVAQMLGLSVRKTYSLIIMEYLDQADLSVVVKGLKSYREMLIMGGELPDPDAPGAKD